MKPSAKTRNEISVESNECQWRDLNGVMRYQYAMWPVESEENVKSSALAKAKENDINQSVLKKAQPDGGAYRQYWRWRESVAGILSESRK